MNQLSTTAQHRPLFKLLTFVALLRLFSLGFYPLADTTEARYAEIARLMVVTGNWITPQIEPGVPFWGKPPLSTWLSAISFKLFGINEFAARLPAFLLSVIIISLVYFWAKQLKGKNYALASVTILATTAVYFISSGAVMTDMALLSGTTLSMVAFYRSINRDPASHSVWGYLFFIGLAISLLAKGPVGLVLTFLPLFTWVILQRRWHHAWQRLPWFTGLLLSALSLLWYLLAEMQTPGFLEYFFVGEHWKRFVDAGWQGDLYGRAHSRPRGMIWLYWLVSALPWSLIAIGSLLSPKHRSQAFLDLNDKPGLTSYLFLWSIAPMVFFTLAGNILWTYVLPGIPAFAMLVAQIWPQQNNALQAVQENRPQILAKVAISMAILFSLTLLIMSTNLIPNRKCQKELIKVYQALHAPEAKLVYLYKRPYSAQFYSQGEAILINNLSETEKFFQNKQRDYFVIRKKQLHQLTDQFSAKVENLGHYNGYYLLIERP